MMHDMFEMISSFHKDDKSLKVEFHQMEMN